MKEIVVDEVAFSNGTAILFCSGRHSESPDVKAQEAFEQVTLEMAK